MEANLNDQAVDSHHEGKGCQGSSIVILSTLKEEIIEEFIKTVAVYCAHKENRFKNIATWMMISLASFKHKAFDNKKKALTNATLHIKDPREGHTMGWLCMNENLLSIRVLPTNLSVEYICKLGKNVQKITGTDKVVAATKIVVSLAGGWTAVVPGLNHLIALLPASLLQAYQAYESLVGKFDAYIFGGGLGGPDITELKKLYDNVKEIYDIVQEYSGTETKEKLEKLDFSKDIYTSEDKANLSKLLESVWLNYLKSTVTTKCDHETELKWSSKPFKAKCSTCKTKQHCRMKCEKCKTVYCVICLRWNVSWQKCPENHDLIYLSSSNEAPNCSQCIHVINKGTPRFQDKKCSIYLHPRCGPYKMETSDTCAEKAKILCQCGQTMAKRIGTKYNECNFCLGSTNNGVKCKSCCLKICLKCLDKNLKEKDLKNS